MDVIEKKIKRERKRKYRLLRKFQKSRDIATRHLNKSYTCNYLRRQILSNDLDWIESKSKNYMVLKIYEWCKRNTED